MKEVPQYDWTKGTHRKSVTSAPKATATPKTKNVSAIFGVSDQEV